MRKYALFLIAGLVFGLAPIASAVELPDYLRDLNRWMGRDHSYYEQRWDPDAERFARFEDRFRNRVERAYRNERISFSEYQHLRRGLMQFDDVLRRALYDGRLSWREERNLDNRQQHLRNDLQASLGRPGSHYGTNPYDRDYNRD